MECVSEVVNLYHCLMVQYFAVCCRNLKVELRNMSTVISDCQMMSKCIATLFHKLHCQNDFTDQTYCHNDVQIKTRETHYMMPVM